MQFRLRTVAVVCAAFLFSLIAAVQSARAQDITGRMSGTVTDTDGRVLVGASVTVTNEATNVSRPAITTDSSGFWVANALPVGTYTVTVTAKGFKTTSLTDNNVTAGGLTADVIMTLGAVQEVITINAQGYVALLEKKTNHDNLYSVALFESIAQMEKSWGQIDDSYMGSVRTDYHRMPVEEDPEITHGLPTDFGVYHVEYLDNRAIDARYKKLRKGFAILKIHPMWNEGGRLKVQVAVYYVGLIKGKVGFGLSEWSIVEFRYDCSKEDFVLSAVKLGGI